MSAESIIIAITKEAKRRNDNPIVIEVWLRSGRTLIGTLGYSNSYFMQLKVHDDNANGSVLYINYDHIEAARGIFT